MEKVEKLKFKKSLVYLISIIPFFIPDLFNYKFPLIVTLLRLAQIIITFLYLVFAKDKKISNLFKYVILYSILLCVITIIKNGDLYYNLKDSISFLGLCLVCEVNIKSNSNLFLKTMSFYFTLLNLLNFICILFFPNGMYLNNSGMFNNWLLGYKNSHILYILPWIIVMTIISLRESGKIYYKIYIYSIISLFFMIKINSSTSIVCLVLLLIFLLFYKIMSKMKFITLNKLLLLSILFFALIVLLRVQDIFSFLFVNLLGKTLTFTGRTYIWDYAIDKIGKSFIIGYGDNSFIYNKIIHSCHNQFLGILYESGIIGFSLYFLLLIELTKKIDKLKSSSYLSFSYKYFIFLYLIIMLMEEYNMRYYIYIFIIIYNLALKNLKNEVLDENTKFN